MEKAFHYFKTLVPDRVLQAAQTDLASGRTSSAIGAFGSIAVRLPCLSLSKLLLPTALQRYPTKVFSKLGGILDRRCGIVVVSEPSKTWLLVLDLKAGWSGACREVC